MIRADGWKEHAVWEHSAALRELYTRRCLRQVEEMTCHAQAAELLAPRVRPGDTLLDAGCGSGCFFHSLRLRHIPVEYWGMDASDTLLDIGRQCLPSYGLAAKRLLQLRLEDLSGEADHIVCLNVLTNIDNYHRPLERMLQCSRKTVILRESLADTAEYRYVVDEYLDPGCRLRVHVNTYAREEFIGFIEAMGFKAQVVTDRRSGGHPEMVIGYPHHWTFVLARRVG
ncbi:MAG: class I SAM-dependent methyltransferase [Desulfobacteraceae bacterium]|nr:MAG: class I SAM-dependent methyltransferase [Desulfobacteraceae bacterium]